MKRFIALLSIALGTIGSDVSAKVIFDLQQDFDLNKQPDGLACMWNPEGVAIGDTNKYAHLVRPDNRQIIIADADHIPGPDSQSLNAQWLKVYRLTEQNTKPGEEANVIRIAPGNAISKSSDGIDHYAIIAYTIQPGEAGNISIQNSRLRHLRDQEPGKISIYVNQKLIGSDTLPGSDAMALDVPLGRLKVGDTVYIACGPGEERSIGYILQFQLASD